MIETCWRCSYRNESHEVTCVVCGAVMDGDASTESEVPTGDFQVGAGRSQEEGSEWPGRW